MKDEDVFDLYKISRCVSSDVGSSTEGKKNNKIFFIFIFGVRYGDFGAVLVEMRNFSFSSSFIIYMLHI